MTPKDEINKAIYVEKSNVLMVFCFPACPCSLAAGPAPRACEQCGRSGPGCRKPHSDCSTAVVWSCWSFYLDFVCVCVWSAGGNGACAGGAKLTAGPSQLPPHPPMGAPPPAPAPRPAPTLHPELGLGPGCGDLGTWKGQAHTVGGGGLRAGPCAVTPRIYPCPREMTSNSK